MTAFQKDARGFHKCGSSVDFKECRALEHNIQGCGFFFLGGGKGD